MASVINASSSGAGGLVSSGDSSGVLQLQNNGSTSVTLDTSGNVGIGVTPSSGTGWANNLEMLSTSNIINQGTDFSVGTNWYYNSGYKYKTTAASTNIYQVGGTVRFQYAASGTAGSALTWSESMRIDSSGNLLVGRTTKQADIAGQTTNVQSSLGFSCYDGTQSAQISPTRIYFNGANGFYVLNASDTGVRLVNGATSWSAQSDERTKTDLIPIANGLEKVNTLRAVTGRYTKDEEGVSRAFLIAQDVKAVLPEAVDEETDEEKTLGLRYTDVIPLLVASIKELKAINDTQAETINALTARIVALESK